MNASPPPTSPSSSDSARDARLVAALAEFERRQRAGRAPPVAEFVAEHADLGDSLRECLEALAVLGHAVGGTTTDPAAFLETRQRIGDFRLARELGRGGMGVVYAAEQVSLGRSVALKILPTVSAFDPRALQRFQHEARAAAALRHPHIVPVYAVGEDQGVHYYAMQLVDGRSLSDLLHERRGAADGHAPTPESAPRATDTVEAADSLTDWGTPEYFRRVARWGIEAAEALQHAHECGIVHRDVKPANLLVERSGRLWVADFGLARLPESDLTGTSDVMGTLRYMAPEQAAGKSSSSDARVDVYSLGATLYELLTLRPAFTAEDRRSLLHKVLNDEPLPPRKLAPRVPVDLETIALKAMAKSPSERYGSARQVAEDLTRFLDQRPILARPPTLGQLAAKWVLRNRRLVATAAALTTLFVVTGIAGLIAATFQIDDKRRAAETALGRESDALKLARSATASATERLHSEQAARRREREMAYFQAVSLAQIEAEGGHVDAAERLLESCPEDLRDVEWGYVRQLCDGALGRLPLETVVPEGTGASANAPIDDLAFRPTGELVLLSRSGATVWQTPGGTLLERLPPLAGGEWDVWQLSPDGRLALGFARRTRKPSADEEQAAPPDKETIEVFDVTTGRRIAEFREHASEIVDVAIARDGRTIASCDRDGVLAIWDAQGERAPLLAADARARSVAFTWDAERLAVKSTGDRVGLRAVDTGKAYRSFAGGASGGRFRKPLVFSPDGRWLASSKLTGDVRLMDAAKGRVDKVLDVDMGENGLLAFSPDGASLATTDHRDYTVRTWNRRTGALENRFRVGRNRVRVVRYSPGGELLATLSGAADVALWDVSGRVDRRFVTRASGLIPVSGDERFAPVRIVAGAVGERVALLRQNTVQTFAETHLAAGPLLIASESPTIDVEFDEVNGRLHQLTHAEVVEWRLEDGRMLRRFPLQNVTRLKTYGRFAADRELRDASEALSPHVARLAGGRVVQAAGPGAGELDWLEEIDVTSGARLLTRRGSRPGNVYCVAATTDGRRRAAAAIDENRLLAWNDRAEQESWSVETPARVLALEYRPDGQVLAAADADGQLNLYASADGRPICTISVPAQERIQFAFSPDGRRLAVAVGRLYENVGEVRLCDTTTGITLAKIPFARAVESVRFRANGRQLLASDYSGVMWEVFLAPVDATERVARHPAQVDEWRLRRIHEAAAERDYDVAYRMLDRLALTQPTRADQERRRLQDRQEQAGIESLDADAVLRFERSIKLNDLDSAFRLSAEYYARHDYAAHQRLCRRLFGLVTSSVDESTASMTYRMGVMGPNGVDDIDAFIAMCEAKFQADAKDSNFALRFNRGMAYYRAERFEAAKEDLTLLLDEYKVPSQSYPIVFVYLALTELQLGNFDAGVAWLKKADERYLKEAGTRKSRKVQHLVDPHFPLLHAEAMALIEGNDATTDSR